MSDYEYLLWILDEYYRLSERPYTLIEDKGEELPPHIVEVVCRGKDITNYAVFRFDLDSMGDHLPFFNRKKKHGEAPKLLKKFCDYIILVEKQSRVTAILIEMKRGSSAGNGEQLKATKMWMDYVLNSAERIKDKNNKEDFDASLVSFRRVLLKRAADNKQLTQPHELQIADKNSIIQVFCFNRFALHEII